MLLVTYTVAHAKYDDLAVLLSRFLEAQRIMARDYAYRSLRSDYGIRHTIKALECTWSSRNSWHPHTHTLWFCRGGLAVGSLDPALALQQMLYAAWSAACEKVGLYTSQEHGINIKVTQGSVADYVAKWGHDPSGDLPRAWGVEDELTKAQLKVHPSFMPVEKRLRVADDAGYSAWDLLRWYRAAQAPQAAALFQEFASVMHGRNQLVWSRGARAALLGTPELDDQSALQEQEVAEVAVSEKVLEIQDHEWQALMRRGSRGVLLSLGASGGRLAMLQYLASLVAALDRERDAKFLVAQAHERIDNASSAGGYVDLSDDRPGFIPVGLYLPAGVTSMATAKSTLLSAERVAFNARAAAALPEYVPLADPAGAFDQSPTSPCLMLAARVENEWSLTPYEFLLFVYWISR
jgi:hypothetical protein